MSGAPYRPTIGLTTQTLHSIDGIPPALPESWVMNQRYFLIFPRLPFYLLFSLFIITY